MPGRYYEEFTIGETIEHAKRRTISEADNQRFCDMTMNQQPLHLDADFAEETQFGERLVNGLYTMSLAVGVSIPETTDGTIVANLSVRRRGRASESGVPRRYDPCPVDRHRQAGDERRRTRHRHDARGGVQNR